MRKVIVAAVLASLGLLIGGFLIYGVLQLRRPARTTLTQPLYPGVTYQRVFWDDAEPVLLHLVKIDTTVAEASFLVTPPDLSGGMEHLAQTTGEFAATHNVQLAINGAFFDPFEANTPWDYYPKSGEPVNVFGINISNRDAYSTDTNWWAAACITGAQLVILQPGCPAGTEQAVSGNLQFLRDGALHPEVAWAQYNVGVHPRTVIATDVTGQIIWLIVVDGRQTDYSTGVSLADLGNYLLAEGVYSALNLDGGGSSTLIHNDNGHIRVLNAPYHTRIPMRQRPVANHLGVFIGQ